MMFIAALFILRDVSEDTKLIEAEKVISKATHTSFTIGSAGLTAQKHVEKAKDNKNTQTLSETKTSNSVTTKAGTTIQVKVEKPTENKLEHPIQTEAKAPKAAASSNDPYVRAMDKLARLDRYHAQGVISDDDYFKLRKQIIQLMK